MWDRLRSIWSATDLRNKILFTIAMLLVYRIIAHVPVPGIDPSVVNSALSKNGNLSQIFGLLSVFSGGSISNFSIVGLGVYPYITASIVIQLLQPIIPALHKMGTEDGEAGRNKLSQITRYISVPLAFLQALSQLALFASIGAVSSTRFNLLNGKTFVTTLTALLVMTTGVMILVWIGEVITESGIGNGISLIIFTGILSRLPSAVQQLFVSSGAGGSTTTAPTSGGSNLLITFAVIAAVVLVLIYLIVYVTNAQRRVPVQYPSKRMIGRSAMMETRQSSYIPINVNQGGMIPLIFAQSLLLFPVILASYLAIGNNPVVWLRNFFTLLQRWLDPSGWVYPLAFFLLVFAFTFFYAEVLWEQQDMSNSLRKQGAFIAGVRPGPDTASYLWKVLRRVTLGGALFLAAVAISPYILSALHVVHNSSTTTNLLSAASIIIVVQVALDTVKQVQAQVVMRNYTGFLR
jgi:preprotein translocase subunit SecY